MNLYKLIRSGLVRRWHTDPDMAHTGETNAQHQWAVASLVLALHPAPSLDLVREALWHDVGEMGCGDLPAYFKAAQPDIAAAHAEVEAQIRAGICPVITDLAPNDLDWLILCDRLAAWLWMAEREPRLIEHVDWRRDRDWIGLRASQLGCGMSVELLLLYYDGRE